MAQPKNTPTAATASTSSKRKTAQWAAIDAKQQLGYKNKPGQVGCFVVPVFNEDGTETKNVIRDTKSATLCMVMVMSSEPAAYNKVTGFYDQKRSSALILAPKALLATHYTPWKDLGGRIVTRYGTTTDANHRDILMGIGTDIPCVTVDADTSEMLYVTRTQKWSPDIDDADDARPTITNLDEIQAARIVISNGLAGKLAESK